MNESRSEKAQQAIDKLYGLYQLDCIRDEVCPSCGRTILWFRDTLSRKEWGISGLCQSCQDSVFEDAPGPDISFDEWLRLKKITDAQGGKK